VIANIRTILAFYSLLPRPRLALVLIGGLMACTPFIAGLVSPLIVGDIIDGLAARRLDSQSILYLTLLYVVSFGLSYFGEVLYVRQKFLAAQELRKSIFATIPYIPLKRIREKGSGYYSKLIGDQVNDAFIVLDYAFIRGIILLVRMLAVLVIVLIWDVVLFFIFGFNIILIIFYSKLVHRFTHELYSHGFELLRKAMAYIVETLANLPEILAGQAFAPRLKKYEEISQETSDCAIKVETRKVTLDKIVIDLARYVSQVVLLLYCAIQVINGQMTVGLVWAVWSYFLTATEPVYILRELTRVAVQSAANLETILNHFNEVENWKSKYDSVPVVPKPGPILVIQNLTVDHGADRPIEGLDLVVHEGDVIGVVGLSGEGKSTLVDTLLGFNRSFEGNVLIYGRDIRTLPAECVFDIIGYAAQTIGIINDTLEANIAMGRPLDPARLSGIIERLGLGHLRNRNLGEAGEFISGGERQRIQLARLMYADKRIVIIDEPLLNLDLLKEQALIRRLREFLQTKSGILISHKPPILKLADRIAVLQEGRIVAEGSFDRLVDTNDLFRSIVQAYVESAREISSPQSS